MDRPLSILEVLRNEPLTKRQLAEAMHADTRSIEAEIQRLRLNFVPVCSDERGYWLARTPAEVRECAERLRHRYITQALTARALRRAARRLEAREELRLWDVA